MTTYRPIALEEDGVFGQMPNGAITNIGGTDNDSFTVDGQGVILDDGTSSGGGSGLTLQKIYDNSFPANIKLATGNDLVILDDTDNSLYFKIDSETGKVTITGDLEVLGSSSIIETVIQDSDHWLISPSTSTTIALKIEPDPTVVPIVDIVSIRRIFGGSPVFRIDASGNIHASLNVNIVGNTIVGGDIDVAGLVDGVDISQLKIDFDNHSHSAAQTSITPISQIPTATNVQEALEQLAVLSTTTSGSSGDAFGYEHIQAVPSDLWTVAHNANTFRAQATIYNASWEQIVPDNVKVSDSNTVLISFASPIDGRALIVTF